MRKIFILSLMVLVISAVGFAQDLDTESFVDQLDSGGANQRGCNADQGPSGSYDGDWCYEILTDGTAGLSGADVNYGNTFSGQYSQPSEIESPVIDVTVGTNYNPDRTWLIPAIAANTRPGATSPNYAVIVGDDGGFNVLGFGEWDDKNYEVKVDVFLPDHTSALNNAGNEFVRIGLAIRCQQDIVDDTNEEIMVEGPGFISRQYGCYALLYDSSEGAVRPTKVLENLPSPEPYDDLRDLSLTNAGDATVPVVEFLGSPIAVSEGWHTLGIKASGTDITFTVDSTTVEVSDDAIPEGKAALFYRTSSSGTANETYDHGAKFDYIRSNPAPTPTPVPTPTPLYASPETWGLYE